MIDVQFCVDVSSTMSRPYGKLGRTRLQAFNGAFEKFLLDLKSKAKIEENVHLSLIRFGNQVQDVVKDIKDKSFIGLDEVNATDFQLSPFDKSGTQLAEAIRTAQEICSPRTQSDLQWVFLCTDGEVTPAEHRRVLDVGHNFQAWIRKNPTVRQCFFILVDDKDPTDLQKKNIQAFLGNLRYHRLDDNWDDVFRRIFRTVSMTVNTPGEVKLGLQTRELPLG